jgi:hypothetical protein
MTATTFVTRVTIDAGVGLAILACLAGWLAGPSVGIGVVAGGALALGNLWWLAGRVLAASVATPGAARWSVGAVIRLAVTGAALAIVLGTSLAHPLGIVAGLTVLPFALIARGLALGREA